MFLNCCSFYGFVCYFILFLFIAYFVGTLFDCSYASGLTN